MMATPSSPLTTQSDTPYRFGFALQQVLGWVGWSQALKRFVQEDHSVVATWNEVTFVQAGGLVERLPLPPGLRGTLRGALQTRQGLGTIPLPIGPWSVAARYDALLFNTPSLCRVVPDLITSTPSILVTDVTPQQLADLEPHYGKLGSLQPNYTALKHRVYVWVSQHLRLIIAWSEWARQSLIADYGVPAEKVIVQPASIDLDQWTAAPASPGAGCIQPGWLARIPVAASS
jgi:hypothetical protein